MTVSPFEYDINCDLAEGEPSHKTRALMCLITSANICCGVHAGSTAQTREAIGLALECGVNPGAHPGLPGAFGRATADITPSDFTALLLEQTSSFARLCREFDTTPSHIKLHGALYHLAEASPPHREAFVELSRRWRGEAGIERVFARAGGVLAELLCRCGVEVFPEAFLDRAYRSDGTLVPRELPGAVLVDWPTVLERFRLLFRERCLVTKEGNRLPLEAKTLCVHGDNPAAFEILSAITAERSFHANARCSSDQP